MHYIFLPAFNEERGIRQVLDGVRASCTSLSVPFHILVVNDGSTDRTAQVLEAAGADGALTVLHHDTNRGVDEAFRTGIEYLVGIGRPEDSVILLEADDTNDARSLAPLIAALTEGSELVIASRFVLGGDVVGFPFWRSIPCRVVNRLLRHVFAVGNVTDYTIFFRGYSMCLLQKAVKAYGEAFIQTTGFVANAEILLKLSTFHPRITEVPLVYHYDKKESRSKLRIPHTILLYLKLIYGHLFRQNLLSRP